MLMMEEQQCEQGSEGCAGQWINERSQHIPSRIVNWSGLTLGDGGWDGLWGITDTQMARGLQNEESG